MEAFERKLADWEKRAGERVSDQIRIGIVLRALPADTVREQLLINSGQYNPWVQFREGLLTITRAVNFVGPTLLVSLGNTDSLATMMSTPRCSLRCG